MKTSNCFGLAVLLAVSITIAAATTAEALEPLPSPATLWKFLGFPQGAQKIRDARVNKKGNHPEWERKPKLKAIADPANAESPNPAIKAAAEIKAEEDLAPQKVKAIKYLATVGCGCAANKEDVKKALLAALDDCTEEVRYEAAVAFCQTAGDPCSVCTPSCCDAEVMNKLAELAKGKDAQGCWLEPSARVRAAASQALNACRQTFRPAAVPTPAPKELRELPGNESAGQKEAALIRQPGFTANGSAYSTNNGTRLQATPAGLVRLGGSQTSDEVAAGSSCECSSGSCAGQCPPGYQPCRCPRCGRRRGWTGPCWPTAPSVAPEIAEAAPEEAVPQELLEAPPESLAGAYGAVPGPPATAPNMIGDFFAGGSYFFPDDDLWATAVPIAAGDRRFKVMENNNPIPTDRIYFNYHHFHQALSASQRGFNFDRYTFGIEKTFFYETCSLEARLPFGAGLSATQPDPSDAYFGGVATTGTEFGNVVLVVKALLRERGSFLWSAGLGVGLPTARDARLVDPQDGTTRLQVNNQATFLQPFVCLLWTPNDLWFGQAFLQFDFDTRGNDVFQSVEQGNPLVKIGTLNEQSFISWDLKLGRWLYRNRSAPILKGVAPTIELHYLSTLQNADRILGPPPSTPLVGSPLNNQNVLNITGGLHCDIGRSSTLNVYGSAPLKRDRDPVTRVTNSFDAEFGVQFNRYF